MKKWLILCMAMVLSLALLAGCDSADPNNPDGQEPAPATNSESEDESTSAVPFFFEVEGEAKPPRQRWLPGRFPMFGFV